MEKQIARWSYWLGVASVLLAVVFRLLNAVGFMGDIGTRGSSVGYMSFTKGAVIFLLTAIATANYTWMNTQKN